MGLVTTTGPGLHETFDEACSGKAAFIPYLLAQSKSALPLKSHLPVTQSSSPSTGCGVREANQACYGKLFSASLPQQKPPL